ncbi:MAG: MerR family transcriptional regulator [Acidobacteriota bacterium]|nr:MerR family transcriptional regulator [Acidobacteriota bacterium]
MSRSKNAASKKSTEVHIPDKLYFRIGEVSKLCRLQAYVLRFWETEFPQLKPVKSSTGQRMYRKKDVEAVVRIKTLLYDEGFTIAGARQQLRTESRDSKTHQPALFGHAGGPGRSELRQLRSGLKEILSLLSARH